MKRIVILIIYDKQAIIDRYVGYLLNELSLCCDKIVVVCNNSFINRGLENIEKYSSDIFFRENIGYDAGGFKDALCTFVGWDELGNYDELILVNDSFYGPFIPFAKIFADVEKYSEDFWGLVKHPEYYSEWLGQIPEHIQTYFMVIRKKMLTSSVFKEYWEELPYYSDYNEVTLKHEANFTLFFINHGYKYFSYVDLSTIESINIENNYNPYLYLQYEMIKKMNFPILKRRSLMYDSLYVQTQENSRQSLEFIKNQTNYDITMIWEHLIRIMDVSDLFYKLSLSYILSGDVEFNVENCKNICICVCIDHDNSYEYVDDYLSAIRDVYQIYIFSSNPVLLQQYISNNYIGIEFAAGSILETMCEYTKGFEYICILHDVDLSSEERPGPIGKSYFYNIWGNLLGSGNYITKVKSIFDENSHLGFLSHPMPNFAEYFTNYAKGWDGNFGEIKSAIERIRLDCIISEANPPFTVTTDFWIRGNIFRAFMEKRALIEAEILPYLWIYIVQDAGYYSGIVVDSDYASMDIVNKKFYLEQISSQIMNKLGDFYDFDDMQSIIFQAGVSIFSQKYKRVYIYGIGKMVKKHNFMLHNLMGYLVSDGKEKANEYNGFPVKYISEIEPSAEEGIIICMDQKHQAEVLPLLEEKGFSNCFCL